MYSVQQVRESISSKRRNKDGAIEQFLLRRRRQNLRIGAALGGGFFVKSLMDQAIYVVSVQQLASLDTPMGGEMEALVLEGDFTPENKKQFLR